MNCTLYATTSGVPTPSPTTAMVIVVLVATPLLDVHHLNRRCQCRLALPCPRFASTASPLETWLWQMKLLTQENTTPSSKLAGAYVRAEEDIPSWQDHIWRRKTMCMHTFKMNFRLPVNLHLVYLCLYPIHWVIIIEHLQQFTHLYP
jgi:hypothetical protein